ncbi:MAG: hypothetical protein ABIJ27_04720 [Candidatus Omnitrophota bacterium]
MGEEDIKARIEAKEKELEELKKKLPTSKDKRYGGVVHQDPSGLVMKIDDQEAEIEELKRRGT